MDFPIAYEPTAQVAILTMEVMSASHRITHRITHTHAESVTVTAATTPGEDAPLPRGAGACCDERAQAAHRQLGDVDCHLQTGQIARRRPSP